MVQRVRIRFGKEGTLRLLSHRDLMRAWERLIRRAGLQPRMSEGFTPRPRINFPAALALGIAGTDEVMELELAVPVAPADLASTLAQHAPPGLTIRSVDELPAGSKAAQVRRTEYQLPLPPSLAAELPGRIAELLGRAECVIEREDRGPVDIRPFLEDLVVEGGLLRITLRVFPERSARPREVLAALGLEGLEAQGLWLTRTRVELDR